MEAQISTTRKYVELLDHYRGKYDYQAVRGFHSLYMTTGVAGTITGIGCRQNAVNISIVT